MPEFVHLHVHTHYSLLDGGNKIRPLVQRAAEFGMPALAITDHGNLFGAIEFYQAAREYGVKPILGMEAYVAPHGRKHRSGGFRDAYAHLLLLAMNEQGWKNLILLSTLAYLEGFYYKPRIDRELLARHHEGLICTSACLSGEIPMALLAGHDDEARRIAGEYRDIFGPERFFIEIQNQGVEEQTQINPKLVELARYLGVGLVGTNDVHFLRREDKEAHFTLTCISTGKRADDPDALNHPESLYLRDPAEMADALREWPEAIANTLRIADMCNLQLDFSKKHLPRFVSPDSSSPDEYLRRLAFEGLRQRFNGQEPPEEYRTRLERELHVIAQKGYSSYFLIVNDFVHFAREHGIPASPRGSGVATLLGYALGIGHVDPIRYGLLFERFTDLQRKEDPDVDIDVCRIGRERVIQYVREKYGHVAQIVTYGTLKPRAAVRDVARVMNWPLERVNQLVQLIPEGARVTFDAVLGHGDSDDDEDEDTGPVLESVELIQLYRNDPQVRELIDRARELEGAVRQTGIHAAGVVVCEEPLEHFVPLCRQADHPEIVMTQWDGPTCEKIGLMKIDILGLKNLSIIQRARDLVRERTGQDIDPTKLPLDDPKVYELFRRADTDGVFQFSSDGMKRVLREMQPTRIEDLIAANAMFRPGPMELIPTYCRRKAGIEAVPSVHPLVDDILAETYGIMIYQEQVMLVLHRLGGLPLSRALTLIKAISKKKRDVINQERESFIEGAARNGIGRPEAERLFALIEKFAGYGFNKAHSTGYAILAYQTAWFKTHYPAEFWAAAFSFSDNQEELAGYLASARASGLQILPPDINASKMDFTVDGTAIRFGLGAIKGVGEAAVQAILSARSQHGPFRNLFHFCRCVDRRSVNRSTMEALIRAGAFDRCGGGHRAQWMAALDSAISCAAAAERHRHQPTLFGSDFHHELPPLPDVPPWSAEELIAAERETLGLSLSGHPLDACAPFAADLTWPRGFSLRDRESLRALDGQPVRLCAAVGQVSLRRVKRGRTQGRRMAVVQLEDRTGASIEAVVFPETLEAGPQELLQPGTVLVVEGQLQSDPSRKSISLVVDRFCSVSDAVARTIRAVRIALDARQLENPEFLTALRECLLTSTGPCEVRFRLDVRPWSFTALDIAAGSGYRVSITRDWLARLAQLVGGANRITFETIPVSPARSAA